MIHPLIAAVKKKLTVPPPLSDGEISDAEQRLGFRLPPLFRQLYEHVGNGGFGPDLGLLSLNDLGDGEFSVVKLYHDMQSSDPEDPSWKWPIGLLPFLHWGCCIFSCLDCLREPYPVFTHEAVRGHMEQSFYPARPSFERWLADWLAGVNLFESVYEHDPEADLAGRNPVTKGTITIKGRKPRLRSSDIDPSVSSSVRGLWHDLEE